MRNTYVVVGFVVIGVMLSLFLEPGVAEQDDESRQSNRDAGNVEAAIDEFDARILVDFVIDQEGDGGWIGVINPVAVQSTVLGVHVRRPNQTLRSHLKIADGTGLVVENVVEESAAAEAGLMENDVLVMLDTQKLINQDQLTTLIRDFEPGDMVTFSLFRAGERSTVDVTLKLGNVAGQETVDGTASGWLLETHPRFDLSVHSSKADFSDCKACHAMSGIEN